MNSTDAQSTEYNKPRVIPSQFGSALFNAAGESLTPRVGLSDVPYTHRPMREAVRHVGTTGGMILPVPTSLDRLEVIERLEFNWDSYGSEAPTSLAVAAARSLIWTVYLVSLYARGIRTDPHAILPLPGGGVQIEWQGGGSTIEVEISSEGAFGYLLAKGREPLREFEERDGVPRSQIVELVWSVIQ